MKDNSNQNMNFSQLSTEEKSYLKQKIKGSVYRYILRKRSLKFVLGAAAAAVVILFSVSIFNRVLPNSSPLENFANAQKDQSSNGHVKLILSDKKNIEIAEDNSTIAYSHSGQNVKIGTSKLIRQETLEQKDIVYNTLIVPYGKRSEIVLADGSKVWLNSGSKLIFPAVFLGDKREVYLEGEAIFEVIHNEKQAFVVKTDKQNIEVLGTVFNVSNYPEDNNIYTVLKSGSIQLSYKNNSILQTTEHIQISPNTLTTYNKMDQSIATDSVDVEKYFSWRDGIFIFKNDSLKSIMKKIARYYNVEIVINDQNLANQTFSGYLDVKESIENVMKTIEETETSRFEYQLTENNKLIIN